MSPLETVQSFYSALGRRDLDAVRALFADTIEWREAEGFPYFGGTWTRPQQVVEGLLGPLGRDWDEFSAALTASSARATRWLPLAPTAASTGRHAGRYSPGSRTVGGWHAGASWPSLNTPTPCLSRPPRTCDRLTRTGTDLPVSDRED